MGFSSAALNQRTSLTLSPLTPLTRLQGNWAAEPDITVTSVRESEIRNCEWKLIHYIEKVGQKSNVFDF